MQMLYPFVCSLTSLAAYNSKAFLLQKDLVLWIFNGRKREGGEGGVEMLAKNYRGSVIQSKNCRKGTLGPK